MHGQCAIHIHTHSSNSRNFPTPYPPSAEHIDDLVKQLRKDISVANLDCLCKGLCAAKLPTRLPVKLEQQHNTRRRMRSTPSPTRRTKRRISISALPIGASAIMFASNLPTLSQAISTSTTQQNQSTHNLYLVLTALAVIAALACLSTYITHCIPAWPKPLWGKAKNP